MQTWTHWVTYWAEQMVGRICEWLNGILPGNHRLVGAGYRLAGLRKGFVLPVDRRRNSSVTYMAYDGNAYTSQMKKSKAKAGTSALESDCGFWAYCHISGQPCARCKPKTLIGSINSLAPGASKDLVELCKKMGKKGGTAWFGCCKNPSGQIRIIGFSDCCSPGLHALQDCGGTPASWCENWPDAKDWCFSSQEQKDHQRMTDGTIATYYCTIAIDLGECTD